MPRTNTPQDGPWPGGARLAVSIVVNVEEGAELKIADGDAAPEPVDELGIALKGPRRNYANESNYRYGIEAAAPRVLDLLERYGVPATFAAAALALERAPSLARALAGSRHEVCAHGLRWVHQHRLDEEQERRFIREAAQSIERAVGVRPVGWLSRYLFTENTRAILAQEGYLYHMDDYSRDWPFWDGEGESAIIVLPYALDTNDIKLWTAPALTPGDWAQYVLDTFEWLLHEDGAAPRMMSLGLHLRIIGRPGRIGALDRVLRHMTEAPGAWIATRRAIAEHFAATTRQSQ